MLCNVWRQCVQIICHLSIPHDKMVRVWLFNHKLRKHSNLLYCYKLIPWNKSNIFHVFTKRSKTRYWPVNEILSRWIKMVTTLRAVGPLWGVMRHILVGDLFLVEIYKNHPKVYYKTLPKLPPPLLCSLLSFVAASIRRCCYMYYIKRSVHVLLLKRYVG